MSSVPVAKAPANKVFERKVHDGWRQACRNSAMDPRPQASSPCEVVSALSARQLWLFAIQSHNTYCCPVWTRFSYTSLIDTQLHSSMRLISGCLRSTPVSWLLVLSNVASPSFSRKAASDKMLQIIGLFMLMCSNITSSAYPPTPNLVRHDTCQHNCPAERGLAVGFCGQLHSCN